MKKNDTKYYCPFCQEFPKVKDYTFMNDVSRWYVSCETVSCLFKPRCGGFNTKEDAIYFWDGSIAIFINGVTQQDAPIV